jgi:hypothetical protein
MQFYRHFCEKDDFHIEVVTDNPEIRNHEVSYAYLLVHKLAIWERLSRTRFYKPVHSWSHLFGYFGLPKGVLRFAREFKPNAILTVAGSWSWMAIMAADVSRKLNVPLIASFMDWWYYNTIRCSGLDNIFEKKFRKFYSRCHLALCISDGMKAALGDHKNAIVLHPEGALAAIDETPSGNNGIDQPFKVAFGGNVGEWYGRMLESLVSIPTEKVQYRIYGSHPSWSRAFDQEVHARGIYHGQVSFDVLREGMKSQDALLLLMGFESECAQIERTSFKTKFIDYLTFQKPILLWGPEYCTAVSVARKFDSAEICTSPLATDFFVTMNRLREDKGRQAQLIANANRMYHSEFHPDKIHHLLKESVEELIYNFR